MEDTLIPTYDSAQAVLTIWQWRIYVQRQRAYMTFHPLTL